MSCHEFLASREPSTLHGLNLQRMLGPVPSRKLVLLVPSAEDDVFECAEVLLHWAKEASETLIVYVNKANAIDKVEYADERAIMASIRRYESQHALETLPLGTPVRTMELQLSDSQIRVLPDQVLERLREELDANSIVLAPSFNGRLADPGVIGRVARDLAAEIGFELHFYPVWVGMNAGSQRQRHQRAPNALVN